MGTKKSNNKKEKSKTGNGAINGASQEKKNAPVEQKKKDEFDETLWQTFTSHPLIRVGCLILIPYTLYMSYHYVLLQNPQLIIPIFSKIGITIRPKVGINDMRQILIVGTQSSGTVQVAKELASLGKLEIGHEAADTTWNFVRDGTVSWFHGIRYFQKLEPKDFVKSARKLCGDKFIDSMGFHPSMYRPPINYNCSYHEKWSNCWKAECIKILKDEWGCARGGGSSTCETPFKTTLHQVRNPLSTIESLVVKFCQNDNGTLTGTIHPSMELFASALFPHHNFTNDNCIESVSYYVLYYTEQLLQAHKEQEKYEAKHKDRLGAMYKIETTSVCTILELGGFLHEGTVIYSPNYERLRKLCSNNPSDEFHGSQYFPIQSTEHKRNVENSGKKIVKLKWKDLQGGVHGSSRPRGDTTLEEKVKNLSKMLGYSVSVSDDETDINDNDNYNSQNDNSQEEFPEF